MKYSVNPPDFRLPIPFTIFCLIPHFLRKEFLSHKSLIACLRNHSYNLHTPICGIFCRRYFSNTLWKEILIELKQSKTELQKLKILLSATRRIATNSPRDVPILSKCDSERVKMPAEAFCSQRLLSILAV